MSMPIALFRTPNWSSYSRSLKRHGSLMVWFDPGMSWFAAQNGKVGHPEKFSAAAIQFCLSMKVLFGLPLHQIEPCCATGSSNHGEAGSWRAFWL